MSYILDALRKAEAERNTGIAHHPHPPQPVATTLAAPMSRRNPWPWIAAAALTSVLAAFIWLRPPAQLAPMPPQPVPSPPAVVAPMPTAQVPVSAPERAAETQQPESKELPAPDEPPKVARDTSPAKVKDGKAAVAKKIAPAATDVTASPIAALGDLPDAIQKQIPSIKVGGYIYSTHKSERSVLINNRVLAEGDEAAPGLTLEKILPDGLVLRYKDYQYRMRY